MLLYVIVFFYVRIFRDGSVLVVDLGHLKVVSNLASRDTSVRVIVSTNYINTQNKI